MSVGVMKDYKLKQRNLRASHTLGWSYRLLILRLFEFRFIPLPVHESEWYLLFFTAMNEEDAAPVHSRKKQYFKLWKDFEFPPQIHHKLRTN